MSSQTEIQWQKDEQAELLMNGQLDSDFAPKVPATSDDVEYITPDGGWGWVVVGAVFLIYLVLDGCIFSFGVIFVELIAYYNESSGKTAVIGSLLYGLPLVMAPLACSLSIQFGFRKVGVIGGLIASFSLFFCTFATSINFMMIMIGFGSFGMEMLYISAILSVNYYFDKRRGFASGLAKSGSGFGTFVFPPLLKILLDYYTWRGTFTIMAGLCLNLVLCSLAFRPLQKKPCVSQDEAANLLEEINDSTFPKKRIWKSTPHLAQTDNLTTKPSHCSVPNINTNEMTASYGSNITFSSIPNNFQCAFAFSMTSMRTHDETEQHDLSNEGKRPKKPVTERLNGIVTIFKSCIDIELLKNPRFVMYGISNLIHSVYFSLGYVYLPHYSQLSGLSETMSSILVSIMGVSSIFSQILLGFIGDKSKAPIPVYMLALSTTGVALTAMAFFPGNFPVLCFLSVLYGIGITSNDALGALILIEILGFEKLSVSLGMICLQQGLSSILGTPIGGWIFDATGSYFWAFISGGICFLLGASLLLPIFVKDKRRGKLQDNQHAIQ